MSSARKAIVQTAFLNYRTQNYSQNIENRDF